MRSVVKADEFTKRWLDILEITHKEGVAQPISFGLIRSDYMVNEAKDQVSQPPNQSASLATNVSIELQT